MHVALRRPARGAFLAAASAVALAAPATVGAGTATVVGRTLGYQAAPGEANKVTITRSPDAYRIVDAGAPIVAAAGCTSVAPNEVTCIAEGVRVVEVDALDGNDIVSLSIGRSSVVRGGDGDDVLEGGEGGDLLLGGAGNDTLKGGTGIDLLGGGAGADVVSGGTGVVSPFAFFEFEEGEEIELDIALYDRRVNPIRVDFDGAADDGESGEGDMIGQDVEAVIGGRADDVLVGDGRGNFFAGGPGRDRLTGGAGFDVLEGGGGDDLMFGGLGRDELGGGHGTDELRGGRGRDHLDGGPGNDRAFGGPGPDEFFALDRRRDFVHGGAGTDCAFLDRRLDVRRSIECLPLLEEEPPPPPDRLTGSLARRFAGNR